MTMPSDWIRTARADGTARVLVIGGGRFAHELSEHLIGLNPTVRVVRLQRSEPSRQPSPGVQVLTNKTSPPDWPAAEVLAGEYDVVVMANSAISPYAPDESTGWSDLRARLPFGLTAALQTKYLFPVAEAVRELAGRRPVFLNACYPDVTNQLAAMHAQSPDWGLGNGHALACFLTGRTHSTEERADPASREIVVVAHHRHLHEPSDASTELLAWSVDGVVQADLGRRLHPFRAMPQQERNRLAATAAAEQIHHGLQGETVLTSVTALPGFLGTVPALLHGFRAECRADRYCGVSRARTLLSGWTQQEGLVVHDRPRSIEFVGALGEFFQSAFGASTYRITEWPELTAHLEALAGRRSAVSALTQIAKA